MENDVKKLNEKELNSVSGGSNLSMAFFDRPEDVVFILNYGDIVYVKKSIFHKTVRCKVLGRKVFDDPQYNCYTDIYHVITLDYEEGDFNYLNCNVSRDDIVNEMDFD